MTVYVVTSGNYSAYSINAMFSTREAAERFIAEDVKVGAGYHVIEDYSIEEWAVDADAEKRARAVARATISIRTGDIEDDPGELEMHDPGRQAGVYEVAGGRIHGWSTEGQEHARAVAVEARQRKLATETLRAEGTKPT